MESLSYIIHVTLYFLELRISFIFCSRRTSTDRRISAEQLCVKHLLCGFSKLDRNSPWKIRFDSIFPNDHLFIDAISVRAIPIAVKIIFVYNSSVDQNGVFLLRNILANYFFLLKDFPPWYSFKRRTLRSLFLFICLFLLTKSRVFHRRRSSTRLFYLFYSPFRSEKDVQYCTRYTVLAHLVNIEGARAP